MSYLIDLKSISSELILSLFAVLILVISPFIREEKRKFITYFSIIGLVGSFIALFIQPMKESLFWKTLTVDRFSLYFKALFLIATFLVVLISRKFFEHERYHKAEYYFFLLLTTVGLMFMVSSVDLISLYVSFELMAISCYVLAGFLKRDLRSNEAGMKYFVLGVFSSGVLLFGFSFLFGLTGETGFNKIFQNLSNKGTDFFLIIAMLTIAGALFFKIAAVPFHMWTPDVYEGAPTPVTAYLSVAPKAACFAIFIRLFLEVLPMLKNEWQTLIAWVSLFTMTYGNIAALTQRSVKRMFAYSSIAHAGYILIGLAAGGEFGIWGMLYYLLIYTFMNIGAFSIFIFMAKKEHFGEEFPDFSGLAQRAPYFSAIIVLILLSLTGIPPTGGFIAKVYIFSAAIKQKLYWLAIAGVLNSVISLYYYFRLGMAMYFKEPPKDIEVKYSPSFFLLLAITIIGLAILLLGIFPHPFASMAKISAFQFLN
ncbi:NADH-quinone oxidoreductase subunit N [Candidatus Aminicenantes bacterium AC-708-M15]|nr:NADH-quinone oxidoreductase subunit N [SCandidatus Aminicenantes bacterium Aminicenantia_JdfR_composite]MCP2597524.1 NADH-quinone oxidoreductase subunit N [Candidatus Aminicenantes bacterium AC-335-G13]MCP2598458.1 NADH-quinone oxidoreductase subunit N [Candidatus Aminicenantes bacterium AC-335-L06]MCP2598988.1 NADH-quinone oxidoreductase subunit N [Candidatus Aminicenantes bacterium AC-335-B20]MCP2604170.1 NADH-quinone oxidoreductase subunit N [Candidatus Aminicenantes bacterium AC-708-M15]